MDQTIIKKIASEYGTPSYVFDEKPLKARVLAIKEKTNGQFELCYSIKANPFLIHVMAELTDKLEVCSPGELNICKALNVRPETIVYSGVSKTKEDIKDAVSYGSGIFTAESKRHLELLNEEGKISGKKLPVLLRLTSGNQFGMSREDIFDIINNKDSYQSVSIEGIHYFAGTQRKKLQKQKDELLMLKDFFDETEKNYSVRLKKLEYGPGLPVPYFSDEDHSDTLAPFDEIMDDLIETSKWCELTVEMGRFFVSSCGYYITKITDIKSSKDTNFVIVDGGINHVNYLGNMMGMKVPVVRHAKWTPGTGLVDHFATETDGLEQKWSTNPVPGVHTVCGSLCTTGDVLIRQLELDAPSIGDILVFENIGAYSVTEGIYLFLSRSMPCVIMLKEDGKIKLVRDHIETSNLNMGLE
ncbi:MAG: alanine racemase [Lachnospiraceae bacterium]|nr:alanine racemase [Lachnospiraceae bacterium]